MTSQEIRAAFLAFFTQKGHHIVPSAPMVIKNDPTLMFTNAGMNQFKDIFLGNMPRQWPRVADSQKCLRVSGKHNDLEEVGHDTYHHTMFEMLGNWSFGDYFKKEAIAFAWEFLTETVGIDKNCLYVTVFGGDEKDGTAKDMEAYNYWLEHVSEDRILFGNKKDNFWEMGETGPCGPCSEIHVDIRRPEDKVAVPGKELVNHDHPQVIEIWNLVFMQFNRKADGHLEELPNKHVDTGMGFERLCMVLQGKRSNYDTDVFQPLITAIARMAGKTYGQNQEADIAMRVIADHVRAVSFAIADGQLPSNNKAGYVIRRILRRAVRYGYTFLGLKEAFIHKLVQVLCDQMGEAFPELRRQQSLIERVVEEEENAFLKTLETGIKLLTQVTEKARTQQKTEISGEDAFTLYDTYGFPIDLTELILKEQGMSVNLPEFEKCLQQQKDRSRNAAEVTSDDWVDVHTGGECRFVGYDDLKVESRLLRYRRVNKKGKEQYQLVFEQTPFYAESGGQAGDRGYIAALAADGAETERIEVRDTRKENKLIIHWTDRLPADPSARFMLVVEEGLRRQTACHHTSTHLMHHALREVLGTHVEQKGSQVNGISLRFDFSHFQKMTPEEIREVENRVNHMIRQNLPLTERRDVPIDEARALGAMALFSEKYGDKVRVIQYGPSVELCGGTHVRATGEIGMFKIVSEGAVAAGVRRIEAVAAGAAQRYLFDIADMYQEIKDTLRSPDVLVGLKKVMDGHTKMKKEIEMHINDRVHHLTEYWLERQERLGDMPLIRIERDYPAAISRNLCTALRKPLSNGVCLITGKSDGKPSVFLMIGDELVKRGFHAGKLIGEVAPMIDGSGGGQPFFASAVGSKEDGLKAVVDTLLNKLQEGSEA